MEMNEENLNLVPEPNVAQNVKIVPLNVEDAFKTFTEKQKEDVLKLADSIDVTQLENVLSYGSSVIKENFNQCGGILKAERRNRC